MGLINDLRDAISANVNEAIENNARPDVMAKYYADKAQKELDESRNRAAAIMANRKSLERDIEQIEREAKELEAYAEKAMQAGNKEDARKFIESKVAVEKTLTDKRKALEEALRSENTTLEAYDAQAKEVAAMQSDMNEVIANVATATSKTASGTYASGMSNRATGMFRKMVNRSRRMVDEADANKEIAEKNSPASVSGLKAKYESPVDAVAEQMAVLEAKYN